MNTLLEQGLIEKSICSGDERKMLLPLMKHIVNLAERTRKNGLLDLDEVVLKVEDPLYRLGLQLILDGTDPEDLRRILNNNILSSGATGIQLLSRLMIVTGVMLIQAGQNPRLIEVELASLVGDDYQTVIEALGR